MAMRAFIRAHPAISAWIVIAILVMAYIASQTYFIEIVPSRG
jgi:hypothetical protein